MRNIALMLASHTGLPPLHRNIQEKYSGRVTQKIAVNTAADAVLGGLA
jgi:hypothetical protein